MFIFFFFYLNIKINERLVLALLLGRAPGKRARPRLLGLVGEGALGQENFGLVREYWLSLDPPNFPLKPGSW